MLVSTVYFSCRTPYAVHLTIQCLHASLGIDKYGDVCKNNGGNTINISSSNHLALAFDAWTGAESLQSACTLQHLKLLPGALVQDSTAFAPVQQAPISKRSQVNKGYKAINLCHTHVPSCHDCRATGWASVSHNWMQLW